MQRMIDEIESGKYNNKKTEKEKVKTIVEERNLTSFMNHTKWKELIDSIMDEMREITIKYKTVFAEEEPDMYWTLDSDELFSHMNMMMLKNALLFLDIDNKMCKLGFERQYCIGSRTCSWG